MGALGKLLLTAATLAGLAVSQQLICNTRGVHMIVARGSEEPQGPGKEEIIIQQVMADVPGSDESDVIYPATLQIPYSQNVGTVNLLLQASQYAEHCPDSKMVLMGYSQGAQITGNVVTGGGSKLYGPAPASADTPPLPDSVMEKVVAIVVFGDVNFSAGFAYTRDGCSVSSNLARTGSRLAAWNKYSNILQSWCSPGDLVCCGTGTSVAAHLSYFTPTIAASVGQFVAQRFANSNAYRGPATSSVETFPAVPTAVTASVIKSTSLAPALTSLRSAISSALSTTTTVRPTSASPTSAPTQASQDADSAALSIVHRNTDASFLVPLIPVTTLWAGLAALCMIMRLI